ncbi:MAG: hypothetical protein IKX70_02105 [Treponema sp.]|nr:hypothetical protein [Treponema sp.]
MTEAEFFRENIENEKTSLILKAQNELWKCNFWKKKYSEISKNHCYQNEFYLIGKKPSKNEVEVYLYDVFKKLRSQYKIKCKRQTTKRDIVLELGLSSVSSKSKDLYCYKKEISVRISKVGIYLMILPYCCISEIYRLDEYITVANIIKAYCHQIITSPDIHFTEFIEYRKKLEDAAETLTRKTVDIAKSSIRSLYEASNQKTKDISQEYLCSFLLIDDEIVCILHKDFLDDPQALIKKLKKNENNFSEYH